MQRSARKGRDPRTVVKLAGYVGPWLMVVVWLGGDGTPGPLAVLVEVGLVGVACSSVVVWCWYADCYCYII